MNQTLNNILHFIESIPSLSKNKIYPNQNEEFCVKSELKIDENNSDELKDDLLILSDKKKDIRSSLLMKNIEIEITSKIDIIDI
jgi:hypothetical protein